jgi:MoxR-like ATPase
MFRGDVMQIAEAAELSRTIQRALQQVIVGKEQTLQHLMLGLISRGNILIEDFPGLAKTLIARLIAQVTGLAFKRIQFTPDLLPGDITGGFIYNQKQGEFEFRPGPLFTNLVLADEVNRAPPKTQAALLEVMQEQQITVDGTTYAVPQPFLVLATQNPIELEGTYPLPEAQLDRFIMRLRVGYPSVEEERQILARRGARRQDKIDLDPVIDARQVLELQATVEQVHSSEAIERYIASLTVATRQHPQVQVGASPRGSLAVYQLARARAMAEQRDFVLPDDVKAMAPTALAHRLLLKPELWVRGIQAESIIQEILERTPVPKAD